MGYKQLVLSLNSDFEKFQEVTANRIAISAADPMWNINTDAIAFILKAEMAQEQILSIRILNSSGELFAAYARDESGVPAQAVVSIPEQAAVMEVPIEYSPDAGLGGVREQLGKVRVYFSRQQLERSVSESNWRQAQEVIAIAGVLLVLTVATLRIVFGPLTQMRNTLIALAGSDNHKTAIIEELPGNRYQELDDLAQGVNQVLRSVRAAADRQDLILSNVHSGIIGLDRDGRVTFTNVAARSMLGYSEEELLDQMMHALVHHSHSDGTSYSLVRIPRHGGHDSTLMADSVPA